MTMQYISTNRFFFLILKIKVILTSFAAYFICNELYDMMDLNPTRTNFSFYPITHILSHRNFTSILTTNRDLCIKYSNVRGDLSTNKGWSASQIIQQIIWRIAFLVVGITYIALFHAQVKIGRVQSKKI